MKENMQYIKFNFTMCKTTVLFIIFVQLTGCLSLKQTKCIASKASALTTELNTEIRDTVEYTCPREYDPKTFTECCHNGGCCEAALLSVAPNDECLLMITAILVICTCLLLTVLVVICCFWSKCPLYNTCRANYTTSNVIVYSLGKEDPTPLMPAEANKGGQYHPYTVKIKKMQEV